MAEKTIIEIKNLSKKFTVDKKEITALDNINLKISEGSIFGIIGMSGAGKSTLVRCINYLEKPTSGSVIFNDSDLSKISSRELRNIRQSITMIFQHFNLLMQRTVEKNIIFPLEIQGINKSEAKKRAQELLEIVGLSEKANAYPSQLSGGQKQRVAIARALATNPKVLLCDEATSALDPATTQSILSLLKDINKRLGITIVIITHEMGVIEDICSHVAIIDKSKIAETGTVEQIFTNPQTESGKKLVFPQLRKQESFKQNQAVRIVFNGTSSFEPVIANMVLDCKAPVNILFADTRNIDGKAFGQIVIQLPEDTKAADKIYNYLKSSNLTVEEVDDYVG